MTFCYKGLFALDKSIENGKPEGLKVFGEWDTIYEGLSFPYPAQVQRRLVCNSIIIFQTLAFPPALSKVYSGGIKKDP